MTVPYYLDNFLIQVKPLGNKHLAEVKKQTGSDQRDGPSYTVLGSGLSANKQTAIQEAVNESGILRASRQQSSGSWYDR